jgi:seryl-tRNA synthetase
MIETELSTAVPEERAPELAQRVYFLSALIERFELVVEDGAVRRVRLHTTEDADPAALAARMDFLANAVMATTPPPAKVVWSSARRTVPDDVVMGDDLFAVLTERGLVAELGAGQVAIAEPLVSLMDRLDRRIRAMVTGTFGAVEYRYPTLVPTRVLAAADYFTSFPQFLMFVTRLHEDLEVYRDFQSSYQRDGRLDSALLRHCHEVDHCLPPTMCYHTFGHYRDRVFGAGPHVVTSRGKSFRHESRYARGLERLWDFTIRETVFLGDRSQVLDARERLMELVFALLDELGMVGFCEVGNDPFFVGEDTSARTWSQRMLELKYEVRLQVSPDRTVAVGSFNFHDDFFGRNFNITRDGTEPLASGCAGFGLERLLFAVLCQHGPDPAGWPL